MYTAQNTFCSLGHLEEIVREPTFWDTLKKLCVNQHAEFLRHKLNLAVGPHLSSRFLFVTRVS